MNIQKLKLNDTEISFIGELWETGSWHCARQGHNRWTLYTCPDADSSRADRSLLNGHAKSASLESLGFKTANHTKPNHSMSMTQGLQKAIPKAKTEGDDVVELGSSDDEEPQKDGLLDEVSSPPPPPQTKLKHERMPRLLASKCVTHVRFHCKHL